MKVKGDAGESSPAADIYSIIRSQEIREYYCREDPFGIFEKEQLILYSYTSIQKKAALLGYLAKTGTEKEKNRISEMCRVFHNYIDRIYHPTVRTVFLLESRFLEWEEETGYIGATGYGCLGRLMIRWMS